MRRSAAASTLATSGTGSTDSVEVVIGELGQRQLTEHLAVRQQRVAQREQGDLVVLADGADKVDMVQAEALRLGREFGDELQVIVKSANLLDRTIDFELVDNRPDAVKRRVD